MATTTTNLGLTKPAYADDADIAVINGNMDTLDTKIGAVGNTDLQSQVTTLNSNISSYWLGNVGDLSALGTAIMSYASSISANKEYSVSFGANANTDYWTSAVVYYGTLYKYSNTTFAASFVGTNSSTFTIATFNSGSSYSHTSSKELNNKIKTTSDITKTSDAYGMVTLTASDFPENQLPSAIIAAYSTAGSTTFFIRGRAAEFLYVNNNNTVQKNASCTLRVIYSP